MSREERGGWMDPRRELGRGLGPVVVMVVVVLAIGALVGVIEGDGAEGKDSVEVKIGSGKRFGEKVQGWGAWIWAVVIGVAMWRLGRQQKRWAKDYGERQLRAMVWGERFRVVEDANEYLRRVAVGERSMRGGLEGLMSGVLARSILFDQKGEAVKWITEFGKRGLGLLKIDMELEGAGEKGRVWEERRAELEEKRKKLVEWFSGQWEKTSVLVEGCVGEVNL